MTQVIRDAKISDLRFGDCDFITLRGGEGQIWIQDQIETEDGLLTENMYIFNRSFANTRKGSKRMSEFQSSICRKLDKLGFSFGDGRWTRRK